MIKPFQFNDENKYNSYGFRILNQGIEMERFNLNPVMLDDHWASTRYVLGKWNDVKLNGASLTGLPEFDMEDTDAARVAGKVERGYIKSCSMGVLFDPADMQWEPNGKYVLNKCELYEVSIVAIPSNANAVRLYVKTDKGPELMTDEQIKLCLSAIPSQQPQILKQENTMKKVFLNTASLMALSLADNYDAATGIDQSLVDVAVAKLKADNEKLTTDLAAEKSASKALADNAAATKKLAIETKVKEAITSGKIDATAETEFVAMGLNNEATLDKVLGALPAKKSLGATVDNKGVEVLGEVKTMEDFQKLTQAQQLAFKAEKPEAYAKLVATI